MSNNRIVGKVIKFVKKETVLSVAWALAIISAFFVVPSKEYLDYIHWNTIGMLWCLMIIVQGMKSNYLFDNLAWALLERNKKVWQLNFVLVFLCFFTSMFITNDVALITFVPFAIMLLKKCHHEEMLIPVIVLQTIAANLGSMFTPIGNPHNLYLYELTKLSLPQFLLTMAPYSLAAAVMLVVALCLIKGGKSDIDISSVERTDNSLDKKNKFRIIVYLVLFVLALLSVLRILPWYVLLGIVFVFVVVIERKTILEVDYYLLATFIGFFIFTGNMSNISWVKDFLGSCVKGAELPVSIIVSQFISNVPATLLLSGFSDDFVALMIGADFGGLGTLIASMASLISYKYYVHEYNENKGKYILRFSGISTLFLIGLCIVYALWAML